MVQATYCKVLSVCELQRKESYYGTDVPWDGSECQHKFPWDVPWDGPCGTSRGMTPYGMTHIVGRRMIKKKCVRRTRTGITQHDDPTLALPVKLLGARAARGRFTTPNKINVSLFWSRRIYISISGSQQSRQQACAVRETSSCARRPILAQTYLLWACIR